MASLSQHIQDQLKTAIEIFWSTRNRQKSKQKVGDRSAQGNRGAVTGGKQLDGFIRLLTIAAMEVGVPETWIFTKGNQLPGFFRPTKDWDLLIVSPQGKLLVAVEFKSQVGSFGKNFNNRTEEALGSAVDLWTAFRENAFPSQQAPWVGYMMIAEKAPGSISPIRLQKFRFKVFEEFEGTSYLERYRILCRKLVLERHYSAAAPVWTSSDQEFGSLDENTSPESFLFSMMGYLKGKIDQIL
ncbi:MAG: PaeR7I family type II restriction endonuclease [Bacteroidota bacterium]